MRILLISILGLLTLASCTKQEPMEELIDRVFTVAEQQYTAMDTRLTEKTLDRKSTRLNSSHKVQSRMPSSA